MDFWKERVDKTWLLDPEPVNQKVCFRGARNQNSSVSYEPVLFKNDVGEGRS